ncbi:MAG: helix-turn-helix transcriptional regulator [Eubacteriales bacterium]|nr:helix-turn-helix transcriptional regulator [Eubacteriales bacterium]
MNESIGNRISKYRKDKGMTQEELASGLGVSSQAVSKWENDISCPDISLLPQLCRILGITSDELLTGKTNEVKMLPVSERRSLDELTLRVYVNSADGDRVRVNIPMSLVKVCLELGVDVAPSIGGKETAKNLDFGKIIELVEQGAIGKLVEVESSDGDTVEVVVE